jgi:hypothetical protein
LAGLEGGREITTVGGAPVWVDGAAVDAGGVDGAGVAVAGVVGAGCVRPTSASDV